MLTKPKIEIQSLKTQNTPDKPVLMRRHSKKSFKPALSFKKRKKKRSINLTSWHTTDVDEIERRRFRAQTERFKYQSFEPQYDYFGSFEVKSSERQYRVEIRSLNEHINSCDCLDYRWNQLGTCKHIEYILWHLQKNRKRLFKERALEGSSRIEIYLDRRDGANTLHLARPKNLKKHAIYEHLESFFKSGDVSSIHLPEVYSHIQSFLADLNNKKIKNNIRLSNHLQDIIEREILKREIEQKNTELLQILKKKQSLLKGLKFPLYPYQEQGMLHLVLNRRALLADEMGLGKTVQAIAACELLKRLCGIQKVLVIATASLKAEWEEQISKFTDLKSLIIQGTRPHRLKQYQQEAFFYLTNYEQVVRDGPDIQHAIAPDVIILDEAQCIKNWQTKVSNAVKQLKSSYAFVLTGTPLENRIDDIYSITQFLDPYLFGPLFRFNRSFYQLDEVGKPVGYKNLDKLHEKLKPIMLRRRKEEVEGQLPARTVNHYFVSMEPEQRSRYEEYETKIARLVYQAKKRPLRKEEYERLQKWLACMRMLCDSPYILDPNCHISPKIRELENILEELLEDKTAKIIIFSEWERMLELVLKLANQRNWECAWHTGKVSQSKRREAIHRFKENSVCHLFLSTDTGSLGLNLQVANIVINLDLPWNPAKLEQRIARAWRKHQIRTVRVIHLICQDSIEHRMLGLLSQKQILAKGVLEGDEDLKVMELPSGRKAFMERMESLIHPFSEESEEAVSVEKNTASSLERFSKTIHTWVEQAAMAAKVYGHKPLIVVSNTEENVLKNALILRESGLEFIDHETLALIQRLEKNGILTLNTNVQFLPTQSEIKSWRQVAKENLHRADEHLNYAIRKQSIAHIFREQGFVEESLSSFRESLTSALRAFLELNELDSHFILDIDFIERVLMKQYGLPDAALDLWVRFNHSSNSLLEKDLEGLERAYQKLIEGIQNSRTRCIIKD